jgi:hypothetical protein
MVSGRCARRTAGSKCRATESLPASFCSFRFHPGKGRVRLYKCGPLKNGFQDVIANGRAAGRTKLEDLLPHVRRPVRGAFSAAVVTGGYFPSKIIEAFRDVGDLFEGMLTLYVSKVVFLPFLEREVDGKRERADFFEVSMAEDRNGALSNFLVRAESLRSEIQQVLFVNALSERGIPLPAEAYTKALSELVIRAKVNTLLKRKGIDQSAFGQSARSYYVRLHQFRLFGGLRGRAPRGYFSGLRSSMEILSEGFTMEERRIIDEDLTVRL